MERAEALFSSRRRNGPSLRIALQAVGQALGVDWSKLAASEPNSAAVADMAAGPTIAELAAMAPKPL